LKAKIYLYINIFLLNPELLSKGKEAVLWNKDSLMNIINSKLSNVNLNQEKIIDKFSWYNNWRKENSRLNLKFAKIYLYIF
jgi:hypothetical protein